MHEPKMTLNEAGAIISTHSAKTKTYIQELDQLKDKVLELDLKPGEAVPSELVTKLLTIRSSHDSERAVYQEALDAVDQWERYITWLGRDNDGEVAV